MPELPEVETMRRGIAAVVGSRIVEVDRPRIRRRPILISPTGAALRRRLIGRAITATDRLGKRVVARLDSGDSIIFEPRMTGLVLLADPPTREHLRLRLFLESPKPPRNMELLFWDRRGLGLVRVVSQAELAERYGPEKLGIDALVISADELGERLSTSRRAIKVALLDQRAVAGIGNLYASEILHLSAIHPAIACNRLRDDDWRRLHKAILSVLTKAIRYEGSTLSDGTYRNALNEQGGYQNHHRVYDRAGQPCPACKTEIVRVVQAQRSTFFCPVCQPRKRKK
ncbi:MAG TPA: bifunctional DNA-formamidopyrimidine glycosylase/DNA-(apurinic or apyrimidinic site) lyase [Pirellulales bacterium]|jgi:formamidopyrimidine-DNA glycosylase